MRLFSVKEAKQLDLKDKVRESIYLNKRLQQEQDEWNQRKLTLDPEKARLEREFLSFSKNLQDKKSTLLHELSELEARKEAALESLDSKWYELEVREEELTQQASLLVAKEKDLAAKQEGLVERLMIVEDKLAELKTRELDIINKEQAIKAQQKFQAESQSALTANWTEFRITQATEKAELQRQREQIIADEESIKAREALLLKEREELTIFKKQLDDRQGTLQRGFEELRHKQHGQSHT